MIARTCSQRTPALVRILKRGDDRRSHLLSQTSVCDTVPDYPKRPVPRDEDAAKALKKRTLTNLYNVRPPMGSPAAHEALDAAVAAAYGWSADISDDEVLRELLALTHGLVRRFLRVWSCEG